jgi:hypothetical protein
MTASWKWLGEILEQGDLTDNGQFSFRETDGQFRMSGYGRSINVHLQDRRYAGWKKRHKPEEIWNFLCPLSGDLVELFNDSARLKDHLILFGGGEYEHNTPDPLFRLQGYAPKDFSLHTGNLIGQISRGEHSLKVTSRFGDDFLKYMIADADGFLEMERFGGIGNGNDLKWLLVYLWKIKLKRAFRLGQPKQYVPHDDRLSSIRGTINVMDHVLHGSPDGKVRCSYREHSYNNAANRLVAETFRKLKRGPFESLINDCHTIQSAFMTATEGQRPSRRELLNTKSFSNPFYHDYNEVIELSKRLLQDQDTDFGASSDFSAFFFDVSMLFEHFIRKLLIRSGLFLEKKGKALEAIPTGVKTYNRRLFPDILFEQDGNYHLFDVKYKNFDLIRGVKREDLFQIHTYLGQLLNKGPVARCGFIYPSREKREPIRQEMEIGGTNVWFEIWFLHIPPVGETFKSEFKTTCEQFGKAFVTKGEGIFW